MSSFVITLKWCNKAVQWQGRPRGAAAATRDIEDVAAHAHTHTHECGVETRTLKRGYCHETDCKCRFPLQQPEPLRTTNTDTHTELHTDTHALAYFNRMLLTGRDVHALGERQPRLLNPLLTLTSGWESRFRRHFFGEGACLIGCFTGHWLNLIFFLSM